MHFEAFDGHGVSLSATPKIHQASLGQGHQGKTDC